MTNASWLPSAIIVRTGLANVASVRAAFERLGQASTLTGSPADVVNAPLVVLPGVGAFGAAMDELRRTGLDTALLERISLGKPLLAICLGLQVLCTSSEESPGVAGLGVIPARITRLASGPGLRTPHLGWNAVTPGPGFTLAQEGTAYFANSFKLDRLPAACEGWSACTSSHGGAFVAAVQRGSLLACQFHPELSGAWGTDLIRTWVRRSLQREGAPCSAAV